MTDRPTDKRFHVVAPARAYAVLVAVSGLILAIGLAIPLALASTPSDDVGGNHAGAGPIDAPTGSAGGDDAPDSVSTADQLPDTGQGITDTTVKVGVVLMDLTSVEPLGLGLPNFSTEIQQAAFDSIFDAVNAAGGVAGRQIEPVYESRDTLASTGPHSDKAICLKLTEDEQVFAVIGFTYDAGVCAAAQHQLPVVTQIAALEEVYQDSHNLLVTLDPALERTTRNWAKALVATGLTDGHKLGMVTVADGADIQLPAEAAAKELDELGHPLAVTGALDPANSIAEIPTLIQKMKQEGVDSVMLASDFANALRFIALAEAQHYYPQYLTSDLEALARNGLLANAGKSLDGAIGFTTNAQVVDGVAPAQNQACIDDYNANAGGPHVAANEPNAVGVVCGVADVFLRALTGAGTDLSPRTFVQAVEGLGSIDGLPVVISGDFAPGKTDYADSLQPVRWSSDCACYTADGDPITVD